MDSETPFIALAPPVFKGENYQIWAARMEAYLEANDLWDAVKEDYEVPPLTDNPTMAQLKSHNFRKSRKSKAKATLFAAVSEEIFTRIMNQKSAFDIWNFLKTEYAGDEKLKGMQKLNLIREFEMQQMKESETIKEYTDKLLSIANKIRLLGSEFSDSKIVQKILVTVPERFDATISSMESSKDLSTITLAELNSALQAQEQRRLMRIEGFVEGALQAKLQINHGEKDKKKSSKKNSRDAANSSKGEKKRDFPPCKHCGKKGHPPFNGCTNHMTGDEELFRELDRSQVSNVRIGNGDCIPVKGKGTVAIESCTGTKLISDVLYVPDIDQNLLSVGQLVEKGFKVIFENKLGIIKDTYDNDVIRIKMRGKSFLLDPMEEEQAAYTATTTNTETWHKRLGHFHHAAILNLQKRKLIKRDKLDKRAEPGIFVGYSLTSNAYRVFQPDTRRILISRDVSFMENDKWSWNNAEIQQPNDLNHDELIDDPPFKEDMMRVFEMTDLGEMSYFLGMEIKQRRNEIFICQQKYAKEILKKFNMDNCKSVSTPMCPKEKLCRDDGTTKVNESMYRSLIGCLMYLTATRPDIMYAVSVLSRFMNCASESHFKAGKRVLRYVKGTLSFGVKDVQKGGAVRLKYCKTEDQLADIFTKPLAKGRFENLRERLGICIY
nr:Retrovirus-related Pol polyprotein from transposon TNT 1-94 [Ipomoea batatas]